MISLSNPTKPAADWGAAAPKPAAQPAPVTTAAAPPPTGAPLPLVKPLAPQINVATAKPTTGAQMPTTGGQFGGLLGAAGQAMQLTGGPTGSSPLPTPGGIPARAGVALNPALNGPQAAANNVPGAGVTTFGPGGDLRNAQVLPEQGADRFAIAQQRYNEFLKANQPGDFDMTREIGQRASAAGRLGMGGTTDAYDRLVRTLGDRNNSAKNSYLTDALEGTIGDQRSNRDEIRVERGYQGGQAQQHLDNQYRELDANDRIGSARDPWAELLSGSGQLGQQAGQSGQGIYDLLRQYAYGRSVDPNLDQYGQYGAPGSRSNPGAVPMPGASTLYGQRPGTSYYGG